MAALLATIPGPGTATDDDTRDGSSSSPHSTTTNTTSGLASPPFLSLAEPAFTPLSMASELFPDGVDEAPTAKPLLDRPGGGDNAITEARATATATADVIDSTAPDIPTNGADQQQQLESIAEMAANFRSAPGRTPPSELLLRSHGGPRHQSGSLTRLKDLPEPKSLMRKHARPEADASAEDNTNKANENNAGPDGGTLNTDVISPTPLSANLRGQTQQHDPNLGPAPMAPATTVGVSGIIGNNFLLNRNSSTSTAKSSDSSRSAASSQSVISQLQEHLHQEGHFKSGAAAPTIIRTTSQSRSLTVRHPVPDFNARSRAYTGNIATLEATAERLSLTSSIEDAIRDLHGELKRSDSRRSSILAASVRACSEPDVSDNVQSITGSIAIAQSFPRHQPSTTSIVELNSAARHGGYSPGGYFMSPSNSLTSRLRSASKDRPELMDDEFFLARTGAGKGSIHSVRSMQRSLAEIAESEPTALTQHVLDEADRTPLAADEDDDTIRPAEPKPSTDAFHEMLGGNEYFERPTTPELGLAGGADMATPIAVRHQEHDYHEVEERPVTRDSTSTTEQARDAFADFDGAHCETDDDERPHMHAFEPEMELAGPDDDFEPPPPVSVFARSQSHMPPPPRPTSYLDPETGQQMLYYPARVPVMLNLPQKLSRKPKAAMRNQRQSKVLEAMMHPHQLPPASAPVRESWLPDPLEGHVQSPFSGPESPFSPFSGPQSSTTGSQPLEDLLSRDGFGSGSGSEHRSPGIGQQTDEEMHVKELLEPEILVEPPLPQPRQRSPRRAAVDPDVRRSRMSVGGAGLNLPPQLRASAFFDLPSQVAPTIELQDGSAMKTLDSILDAAAKAPVSAFTDHVFAGKLGAEVYGTEKKRKSAMPLTKPRPVSASSSSGKKRGTFLGFGKKNDEVHRRSSTMTDLSVIAANGIVEHGHVGSVHSGYSEELEGAAEHDPDAVADHQEEDEDAEEEEEEETYQGPPTTLLAELQIRKQQQKLRTRPINRAYPNGMHATLLELDAVAEAQRNQRAGKRINLAWEDPADNEEAQRLDDEDDDVPLGILYAAKAAGNNDIMAAAAELHRPLGLMERRELEDNEPLSQRRARLQGLEAPQQLSVMKRRSMFTLNDPMTSQLRLSRAFTDAGPPIGDLPPEGAGIPGVAADEEPEEEIEEESLADRMKRLRAKEDGENALPRARPVSMAFTAELLDQFGPEEPPEEVNVSNKNKAGAAAAGHEEEEETLGQRRKRLQAEREARQREMGGFAGPQPMLLPMQPRTSRVPSSGMGDILGGGLTRPRVDADPRVVEQARRAEEEARYQRETADKMRAFRAGMTGPAPPPSLNVPGGFRSGLYNDGRGGGISGEWNRASGVSGIAPSMLPPPGGYNAVGVGAGYGGPYHGEMQGSVGAMPMPMQMQMPVGTGTYPGMHLAMGMQRPQGMSMGVAGQPQGQGLDAVERWRQSVMP